MPQFDPSTPPNGSSRKRPRTDANDGETEPDSFSPTDKVAKTDSAPASSAAHPTANANANVNANATVPHSQPTPQPAQVQWTPYPADGHVYTTATSSSSRMDPSMFGRRIEDDMVLKVAEFLRRSINSARSGARGPDGRAPHIEIEGKLGIILNKDTRSRLQLPVQSETVITTTPNCRFESDMTMDQHAHFNNILNSLVRPGGKTIYKHKYEMDHYHQQGGNKLRVTVDTKTNQVKEVMVKKRIADLEVHLPNSPLDFRISVNLEIPAQPPPKGDLADYKRYKDRLSYTHEAFAVDLTQVKEFDAYDRPKGDPKHELEIEFLRMPELLQEKNKWENKQQHRFYEYVEVFLSNLRMLSRKALPQQPMGVRQGGMGGGAGGSLYGGGGSQRPR